MAMSFGQNSSDGKSMGPLGHGGEHRVGGHGTATSHPPMSSPHVKDPKGHTMSNSHGGSFPVGC